MTMSGESEMVSSASIQEARAGSISQRGTPFSQRIAHSLCRRKGTDWSVTITSTLFRRYDGQSWNLSRQELYGAVTLGAGPSQLPPG